MRPGRRRGPCWNGSPYQPIPVDDDADAAVALQIMERQEDFPGVTAEVAGGARVPATAAPTPRTRSATSARSPRTELDKRKGRQGHRLNRTDLIGRAGLETKYDADLRGTAGRPAGHGRQPGHGHRHATETAPRSRRHARHQHRREGAGAIVGAGAQAAVDAAPTERRRRPTPAAGVVMDVRTGRIIALASYPTYDPKVGSAASPRTSTSALLDQSKRARRWSRGPSQGQFAPGSTFKVSSLPAAVDDGYPLHGTYRCPASLQGRQRGRSTTSRASRRHHQPAQGARHVLRHDLLQVRVRASGTRDGGHAPEEERPRTRIVKMAQAFGFGKPTGHRPAAASRPAGSPTGRGSRSYWDATKATDCKHAKTGYPEVAKTRPARAAFLKPTRHGELRRRLRVPRR